MNNNTFYELLCRYSLGRDLSGSRIEIAYFDFCTFHEELRI